MLIDRFLRSVATCFLRIIASGAFILTGTAIARAGEEPYTIGVILPLSGDYASLGLYSRRGVELALDDLPSETRKHVKLIFEDDQLHAATSVTAYHKLAQVDGASAFIVLSSGVGNALAPLAERDKRPLVAVGASDAAVSRERTFVFTHWVSPEAEGTLIAKRVAGKDLRIGIVTSEQEGAVALANAFRTAMGDAGAAAQLVVEQKVLPESRDLRSIVMRLKAAHVNAVCAALLTGNLAAFAKQARELKLGAELFGFELFEDAAEVKASDGALVGAWYANGSDPSPSFGEKHMARYGEPPGFGAANAYDALTLLATAAARDRRPETVAAFLHDLRDYHGAAGTYSATGDNRFALPATLKRVTPQGFERLPE